MESTRKAVEARGMSEQQRRQALLDLGNAARRTTDATALTSLAGNSTASVRMRVAGNKSTPKRVRDELARDRSIHVRAAVASSANTSSSTLQRLMNDSDPRVAAQAQAEWRRRQNRR